VSLSKLEYISVYSNVHNVFEIASLGHDEIDTNAFCAERQSCFCYRKYLFQLINLMEIHGMNLSTAVKKCKYLY